MTDSFRYGASSEEVKKHTFVAVADGDKTCGAYEVGDGYYACVYEEIYIYMHIRTLLCVCVCVCVSTYWHTSIYGKGTPNCKAVCVCVRVCACVRVCVCVCVCM